MRMLSSTRPIPSVLLRLEFLAALVSVALPAPVSARSLSPSHGGAGSSFDGWGTSLCWFGNAVGRWPDPERGAVADALFSEQGLGLTVVRYNIGGGDQPGHRHMPWFRQMEGFQEADGSWHWEADPGQRWMLDAARKRGALRFEAFSNSPPWWMTRSGCASGAAKGDQDNLAPGREEDFSRYLATVVRHFREEWGLRFDTLEPMNEPWTDYWRAGHNQEGCHFDHASQRRLLQTLRRVLDREGAAEVALSASDETSFRKAFESWQAYDDATRACVAQVNAHAYDTEGRTELRTLIAASGKPLVMSEVDSAGGSAHDHESIAPGLALAKGIIDDLRELRPLRWILWQAVEDEGGQRGCNGNWGLIHADLEGSSHSWVPTKKYHVMAQFSRFLRPGSVILEEENPETVVAFDAARARLVIVMRNAEKTEETAEVNLKEFPKAGHLAEVYRTSATENCSRLPDIRVENGRLGVTLPPESVTTLIVRLGEGERRSR